MRNFYQDFKTPIITIVLIFIAFFLYTKLAGPIPFFINSITTTKTDLFSAEGQGQVTAVPDTATVDLGITQQSTTVADAQSKTNKIADKLIADIKKLGISDKDIKTTNYSVNPDYGNTGVYNSGGGVTNGVMMPILPPGGNQQIVGYTVMQNLEIKVKPIDKTNKVIDAGTAGGANLVGGVNFTFSDDLQKSLENKARTQAVNDAKQKAQDLASAAGIHLGRVINVVESSNEPIRFGALQSASALPKTDATTPTNITPGENSVTINVIIYYETY